MKRSRSGLRETRVKGRSNVAVLENVVVCCTGVFPSQKEVLKDRVKELGGSFDVNLTFATTHLLAASTDTEKYTVATSMKASHGVIVGWMGAGGRCLCLGMPLIRLRDFRRTPGSHKPLGPFRNSLAPDMSVVRQVAVVRPDWVLDCWKEGTKLPCEDYVLPPFGDLRITITGLSLERKEELSALIASGGGEYMGAMEARRTTHLVAEVPAGAKYVAATSPEWRNVIQVVHSRWIEQSHRRKLRLPEKDFPVVSSRKGEGEGHEGENGDRRQRQPDGHGRDRGSHGREAREKGQEGLKEEEQQEKEKPEGKDSREHQPQQEGLPENREKPHLDEKNGAPLPTPTRQAVGAGRPAPTGDSAKYPWADDANPSGEASGKGRRHAVDGAGGVRGAEGVPRAEEALALPDGDYLSSCRLIFVGFAAEDLRPLMLLVRKGCGVRYSFPNEEITHVILGDRKLAMPEVLSTLESHPCSPPVVTASWLWESCQEGWMLPTDRYLCTPPVTPGRSRGDLGSGHDRGGDGGGGGGGGGGGATRRPGNRHFGADARKSRAFPNSTATGGGGLAGHPGDPPSKGALTGSGSGSSGKAPIKTHGTDIARNVGDGDRERQGLEKRGGKGGGGGEQAGGEGRTGDGWESGAVGASEEHRVPSVASTAVAPTMRAGVTAVGVDREAGEKANTTRMGRAVKATVETGIVEAASPRKAHHKRPRTENARNPPACPVTANGSTKPRSSSSRSHGRMFRGCVFVTQGTGLSEDEKDRAARIIVSHGGRCLDDVEARDTGALRQALRSAGVVLSGDKGKVCATLVGVDRNEETNRQHLCMVVTAHGKCTGDVDSRGGYGDSRPGSVEAGGWERGSVVRGCSPVGSPPGDGCRGLPQGRARKEGMVPRREVSDVLREAISGQAAKRARENFPVRGGDTKDCGTAEEGQDRGSTFSLGDRRSTGDGDEGVRKDERSSVGSAGGCVGGKSIENGRIDKMAPGDERGMGVELRSGAAVNDRGEVEEAPGRPPEGRVPVPSSVASHGDLGGEGSWATLVAEPQVEVVTTLWLEACHRIGEWRSPAGCREVFCPRPWPIRKFPILFFPALRAQEDGRVGDAATFVDAGKGKSRGAENAGNPGKAFAVAVTGFVGAERAGWEQLIVVMGAELCKSLRKRVTTHLVCKEAKGDKYKTALRWGVPVVTSSWLLRCAHLGYEAGSEVLFKPHQLPASAPVIPHPTPTFLLGDGVDRPLDLPPGKDDRCLGVAAAHAGAEGGDLGSKSTENPQAFGPEIGDTSTMASVKALTVLGERAAPPGNTLSLHGAEGQELADAGHPQRDPGTLDVGELARGGLKQQQQELEQAGIGEGGDKVFDEVLHGAHETRGVFPVASLQDSSVCRDKIDSSKLGDCAEEGGRSDRTGARDGSGGNNPGDERREEKECAPGLDRVKPSEQTPDERDDCGEPTSEGPEHESDDVEQKSDETEGKSGLELQLRSMMMAGHGGKSGSSTVPPSVRRRRPLRPSVWAMRSAARNSCFPSPPSLAVKNVSDVRAAEGMPVVGSTASCTKSTSGSPSNVAVAPVPPQISHVENVSTSPGGSVFTAAADPASPAAPGAPTAPDGLVVLRQDERMERGSWERGVAQRTDSEDDAGRRVSGCSQSREKAMVSLRESPGGCTETRGRFDLGGIGGDDGDGDANDDGGSTSTGACSKDQEDVHQVGSHSLEVHGGERRQAHRERNVDGSRSTPGDGKLRRLLGSDGRDVGQGPRRRDDGRANSGAVIHRDRRTFSSLMPGGAPEGLRSSLGMAKNGSGSGVIRNNRGMNARDWSSDERARSAQAHRYEGQDLVGEESQIVTYGEQYNPATGWIR